MKRWTVTGVFVLICLISSTIILPATVSAQNGKQEVDMLLTKVMDRLILKTNWGNVYFNEKDVKRIVHGAANLRPVFLGVYQTDEGASVHVKIARVSQSVVTFHVWP